MGPEYFPLDIEFAVNKKRNVDEQVLEEMFSVRASQTQKYPDYFERSKIEEYRNLIKHCENDNCVVVYDMLLDERRMKHLIDEKQKPESRDD